MASTPPPYGSSGNDPSPGQKWTRRARVSAPAPTRSTPPPTYGSPRTPVTPPPRQTPVTRPGRRPRWGRILGVALAVLVLIAGAGLVTSYLWVKNVDNDLKRTDPFAQLTGRPQKLADGTL